MKKILAPILLLAVAAFSTDPMPTYQMTPPYLSNSGSLTNTDVLYVCQGTCGKGSDLRRATVANIIQALVDTGMVFTGPHFHILTDLGVSGVQTDTSKFIGLDTVVATKGLRVGSNSVSSIAVLDSGLTGYATKPTDTLRCAVDVFGVHLYFVAGITGTSNDTVLTVGHVPAACRPSHTLTLPAMVTNGNVQRVSKVTLSTAGVFTVYAADVDGVMSATGFSASNSKGLVLSASFSKF